MTLDPGMEPSCFALDVYFANGLTGDVQLAQHVLVCERCAAYLSSLNPLCTDLDWKPPTRTRRAGLKISAFVAASALTLGLAWLGLRPEQQVEYVAGKGVPAVQALIRDRSGVRVWDGKTRIRPGDAIALRADCEGFTHIAVVAAGAEAERRVFDAACPSSSDPLPFTLLVDDKPGVERIHVIFSHVRLDDSALLAALRGATRDAAIWVNQLVLHKAVIKP